MSVWWVVGLRKMGQMSSNKMPGEGKSGNWRKACFNSTLALASWAAVEAEAADCRVSGPLVASGASGGGCEDVEVIAEKEEVLWKI